VKSVLLISCYELGRQPMGLAMPLAFLRRAGIPAQTMDLSVERFDPSRAARADVVAVSVPMHTALRLGTAAARRVRAANPRARIAFFGLYAQLNAEMLLAGPADAVFGGECEEDLAAWILGRPTGAPLRRLDFPVPERDGLAPLERYAKLEWGGQLRAAGSVEASRGCLHRCTHCPIPPVYDGRFFVVPEAVVLEDVRRQVRAGARHVTFADPDFLNGPGHSMRIVRAMHREFPDLTFDFTAKVEHLIKRRDLLDELAACGCLFIVSAVESLSDEVLRHLDKGHTAADVRAALALVRGAAIALRPTFVPFTPWTSLEDYREILGFVDEEGLVHHVDPVQLTIRLLVPPGSLLLKSPAMRPYLGARVPEKLMVEWTHPDPRMDELQRAVTDAVARGGDFGQVCALAGVAPVGRPGPIAPRMTEPWFC
jgi:radical SAM superfamily enzyme YgiQ (UPF0313 family)